MAYSPARVKTGLATPTLPRTKTPARGLVHTAKNLPFDPAWGLRETHFSLVPSFTYFPLRTQQSVLCRPSRALSCMGHLPYPNWIGHRIQFRVSIITPPLLRADIADSILSSYEG